MTLKTTLLRAALLLARSGSEPPRDNYLGEWSSRAARPVVTPRKGVHQTRFSSAVLCTVA